MYNSKLSILTTEIQNNFYVNTRALHNKFRILTNIFVLGIRGQGLLLSIPQNYMYHVKIIFLISENELWYADAKYIVQCSTKPNTRLVYYQEHPYDSLFCSKPLNIQNLNHIGYYRGLQRMIILQRNYFHLQFHFFRHKICI